MRNFLILSTLILIISSCQSADKHGNTKVKRKSVPEYNGVELEFQQYVNKFKELAKNNGITFKKEVSMGSKIIGIERVIGLCYYGRNFREIDIDKIFWKIADPEIKEILAFHELAHCYCNRDHDWDHQKSYENPFSGLRHMTQIFQFFGKPQAGFYDDFCPLSIMYPSMLERRCIRNHYDDYIKEMFQRCEPY